MFIVYSYYQMTIFEDNTLILDEFLEHISITSLYFIITVTLDNRYDYSLFVDWEGQV